MTAAVPACLPIAGGSPTWPDIVPAIQVILNCAQSSAGTCGGEWVDSRRSPSPYMSST